MFARLTLLTIIPLIVSANEGGGSDIFARTINFILFCAIMYKLTGDFFKNILKQRQDSIAKELEKVEQLLKKSKSDKELAQNRLNEAQELAVEIVKEANEEAILISEKISKQADIDISNLTKSIEEKKEFLRRNAIRETLIKVLNSIDDKTINISEKDIISLIDKKVA